MLAYVLSCKNLKIKDILAFDRYEFRHDIDYGEKSSISTQKKPNIDTDDFIVCKDDNDIVFTGLCSSFKRNSRGSEYNISLLQKENLFDRFIFVEKEDLISTVGIEDFIVKAITDNFIASGDTLVDKSYITVEAKTHTKIATKVDAEKGVYNLKTFIGNAKQYYGIYLDYAFEAGAKLRITVYKLDPAPLAVDIEISDVTNYVENYAVSVIAKLIVNWKIPDKKDSQTDQVIVGALTRRHFYLLDDRTISEDQASVKRVSGAVKSVHIETEKEEEMVQQAQNEFAANRYNHKISFSIIRKSKLYPESEFFAGRKCIVKTMTGVQSSIISKVETKSNLASILITLGNMRVSLTDKIKGGSR